MPEKIDVNLALLLGQHSCSCEACLLLALCLDELLSRRWVARAEGLAVRRTESLDCEPLNCR